MIHLKAPAHPLDARIDLPLSKSILNRQLVLCYLAGGSIDLLEGETGIPNDCLLMQRALTDLKNGRSVIDAEDAGTVMRFICAVACLEEREILLKGTERMHQRPIAPLVDSLRQLGADILYEQKEGFPPLRIMPTRPKGGSAAIQGSVSSQFISALTLIATQLDNGLELTIEGERVSTPYVEMTLELLTQFGAEYRVSADGLCMEKQELRFSSSFIEFDWSAAAFWYGIVAMSEDGKTLLKGLKLKSSQGDRALASLFLSLGVSSREMDDGLLIHQSAEPTSYFDQDCSAFPDLAQALAFTCAGLGIACRLSGLGTLPGKETDRITAIKTELGKLGLNVATSPDSLSFHPSELITNNLPFDSYEDHRMAMAESIMAMRMDVSIKDHEAVSKSYPNYFKEMEKAGFRIKI